MSSSRKKWIGMILFVLPLLLLLTGINYLADPANVFHNFSEEMAQAMIEGNAVQVYSNNMDDREVQQYVIQMMPDRLDAIVWGSSTALTIDTEMVGEEEFYNLAVSSASYYDFMASLALMQLNSKTTDRMIISLDSRMFDPDVYMADGRHDRLMAYSEYMLDYLNGKVSADEIPDLVEKTGVMEKISTLFSVSYFQWSIEYIKTHGLKAFTQDRWQIVDVDSTENKYLPDYSGVYAQSAEEVSAEEVINACNIYWMEANVTEYAMADAENMAMFEKVIMYLQEQGTEVELFLCPFAPALWDRIGEQQYPMLFQLEEYASYLASEYGVKVHGSYNPYNVGLTNEDFYDARHVKKGSLKRVIQFSSDEPENE